MNQTIQRPSMRWRLMAVCVTILGTYGVLIGCVHWFFLSPRLMELSVASAQTDTTRVVLAIRQAAQLLDHANHDWVAWNGLSAFARYPNPDFAQLPLDVASLEPMDLDLLYLCAPDGKVVRRFLSRAATGEGNLLADSLDVFFPTAPSLKSLVWRAHSTGGSSLRRQVGILNTNKGVMLVSSRPVLARDGRHSIAGTVIMGRFLSAERIGRIREQTQVDFQVVPMASGPDEVHYRTGGKDTLNGAAFVIEPSEGALTVFIPYPNLVGTPAFFVKARIPGTIQETVGVGLRVSLAIILVALVGVFFGIVAVIHAFFVSPTMKLAKRVAEIRGTGNYSARVGEFNADEIGDLAHYFNDFLAQIEEKEATLKRTATIDELTGIYNRRYVLERLAHEVAVARRYEQGLAIILMDLDHFKKINDTFGHEVGDEVLASVSRVIRKTIRNTDILGRIGGKEFIAVLPNQTADSASVPAKRIRHAVQEISWPGKELTVSISCGIGVFSGNSAADIIKTADKNLLAAKRRSESCG